MADTKNVLTCPACGTKMEKILIEHTGFNIDICLNGCGGIFFDNREFKHFDEKAESIKQIEKLTADKEFIHADESYTRYCPACKSAMVKNFSSANKVIEIDECYMCILFFHNICCHLQNLSRILLYYMGLSREFFLQEYLLREQC